MFKIFDCSLLFAALASFLASVGLWFLVQLDYGVYVGLWVPGILALWVSLEMVVTLEHAAISRRWIGRKMIFPGHSESGDR